MTDIKKSSEILVEKQPSITLQVEKASNAASLQATSAPDATSAPSATSTQSSSSTTTQNATTTIDSSLSTNTPSATRESSSVSTLTNSPNATITTSSKKSTQDTLAALDNLGVIGKNDNQELDYLKFFQMRAAAQNQ